MFDLHPQLQQDCMAIGRTALCRVLLARDANYPWLILVPERENVSEIYQLDDEDQVQLMRDISQISAALAREFPADKINVAALGNIVAQLHVHIVVRYQSDAAWPGPIWGRLAPLAYSDMDLQDMSGRMQACLAEIMSGS